MSSANLINDRAQLERSVGTSLVQTENSTGDKTHPRGIPVLMAVRECVSQGDPLRPVPEKFPQPQS